MKKSITKNVLISGAYTAGLGSAIRKVFFESGWSVIALYDPKDKLQVAVSKGDSDSQKLPVNLKDSKSIDSMVERLPSRINAFVHAAMFFEMDSQFKQNVWSQTLQVNVIAAAQIVERLRSRLRDGGSIVSISSTEAFTGSFGSAAYSASRAAMHNLVQSWANKLGAEGIRANAVAAGWIGGVMDTDEVFNQSRRITPLGRLGLPEEVANTVKFLCSGDASFINGSVVTVDGGYSGVDSVSKYEYQEHLATTDFHRFTAEFMTGRAGANDEIWAISILFEGEWDGSGNKQFVIDQIEAAKRGAKIRRIFIQSSSEEKELRKNNMLMKLHRAHENIEGFIVPREIIQAKEPELLQNIGDGFAAFNDEVLVLDDRTPGSRGTFVSKGEKISSLRKVFDHLMKIARPL